MSTSSRPAPGLMLALAVPARTVAAKAWAAAVTASLEDWAGAAIVAGVAVVAVAAVVVVMATDRPRVSTLTADLSPRPPRRSEKPSPRTAATSTTATTDRAMRPRRLRQRLMVSFAPRCGALRPRRPDRRCPASAATSGCGSVPPPVPCLLTYPAVPHLHPDPRCCEPVPWRRHARPARSLAATGLVDVGGRRTWKHGRQVVVHRKPFNRLA
jgi:hypothetical protein